MSCLKYENPTDEELLHMKKCSFFEIKGVVVANPVVFVGSFVVLWSFVIACCVEPDYMGKAMGVVAWSWIPEVWTWLYILSQDIWVFVLIWAMVKYGDLKLGKDDEVPEYSNATWFSMLFCCGVATGLFYYSVAEPMWHYKGWGNPRFVSGAKGYGNQDEDANMALVVTIYHWGLHGWIPYTTMGAVLGIMAFRRGYPMTIRYAFVPLLGDYVYGWMGDFIDGLSIVTTIAGVCTSLGLGAMQINTGLQRINHGFYRGVNYGIPNEAKYVNPTCGGTGTVCGEGEEAYGIQWNTGTQILIIVLITCLATTSVVMGLSAGIKFLSQFVFALGNFLLLVVMFSGETYFCLDTMVQTVGYYIWYFFRIGFYCDAFERLGDLNFGLGGIRDSTSDSPVGGGSGWLISWTIFYWGWWISWGPYVGTFIAKISRGRTLRSFILATLFVPTLYAIAWFGVWGSEGIRMQRMADGSKLCSQAYAGNTSHCQAPVEGQLAGNCNAYSASYSTETKKELGMGWNPSCVLDPAYHDGFGRCKEFAFTRFEVVGTKCVTYTSWVNVPCGGTEAASDPTYLDTSVAASGVCGDDINKALASGDHSYNSFPFENQPSCFVPVQDNLICLYNQGTEDILFDQVGSYGPRGFSDLLSVVTLVCLTLYFVTSSDSGSLVVDILSANGHPDPPVFQRIFWSFTEGATAIALLYSGINSPNPQATLKALQAASIICGLPYTFILFWVSQSFAILVQEESGDLPMDRKAFNKFIFSKALLPKAAINTLVPGIACGKAVTICGKWPFSGFKDGVTQIIWTTIFMGLYWLAIIFAFCGFALYNWMIVGLTLYIGHGTLLGLVRNGVRNRFNIGHGDLFSDFMVGIFVPMFTIAQIEEQLANDKPKDDPPEQNSSKEAL